MRLLYNLGCKAGFAGNICIQRSRDCVQSSESISTFGEEGLCSQDPEYWWGLEYGGSLVKVRNLLMTADVFQS
jgi:hypothetical protein